MFFYYKIPYNKTITIIANAKDQQFKIFTRISSIYTNYKNSFPYIFYIFFIIFLTFPASMKIIYIFSIFIRINSSLYEYIKIKKIVILMLQVNFQVKLSMDIIKITRN